MEEELKKQYQILRLQISSIEEEIQKTESLLLIIKKTLKSIEKIEKNQNVKFSVNNLVFIDAKILKKEFLINIGSDVFVEVEKEKVIDFIKKKERKIEENLKKLLELRNAYLNKMSEIAKKLSQK